MTRSRLPTAEDYALGRRCSAPKCGAEAGQPCNSIDGRLHARRLDLGATQRRRDIGNAPWPSREQQ